MNGEGKNGKTLHGGGGGGLAPTGRVGGGKAGLI